LLRLFSWLVAWERTSVFQLFFTLCWEISTRIHRCFSFIFHDFLLIYKKTKTALLFPEFSNARVCAGFFCVEVVSVGIASSPREGLTLTRDRFEVVAVNQSFTWPGNLRFQAWISTSQARAFTVFNSQEVVAVWTTATPNEEFALVRSVVEVVTSGRSFAWAGNDSVVARIFSFDWTNLLAFLDGLEVVSIWFASTPPENLAFFGVGVEVESFDGRTARSSLHFFEARTLLWSTHFLAIFQSQEVVFVWLASSPSKLFTLLRG
jgi:hypothetical protein